MPFAGLILDFYPQALNLIMAVPQTQLFAIYPLPNIEINSATLPTLPIPSEKPVDRLRDEYSLERKEES